MGGGIRRRVLGTAVAALAALSVAAPAAVAEDPALVGQWHLDEVRTDPRTTPDSSGHGLSGVAQGTLVPGRFGNALEFRNENDSVKVENDPLLEPARVTVMAWVKRAGAPADALRIVSKAAAFDGRCVGTAYELTTGESPGDLRFFAATSGVDGAAADSPSAPVWDGRWHAIAGTFDGTTAGLWIDGKQVGSAPAPDGPTDIAYGSSGDRPLHFGQECNRTDHRFDGALDEVRIYSRALSSAEIAYLQRADHTTPPSLPIPKPPPPPPALIARLAAPPATKLLDRVTLDAGATTGTVSQYRWDLNSDGQVDAVCRGDQPQLTVRSLGAATQTVTVTAVGVGGLTSKATATLATAPGGPSKPPSPAAMKLAGVVQCVGKGIAGLFHIGGPPVECTGTTIAYGLVAATGCLARIGRQEDMPALERRIVDEVIGSKSVAPALSMFEPAKCPIWCVTKIAFESTDFFVSPSTINVNGLDIEPRGGATVVFHPQLMRVVSSNAIVRLGPAIIMRGRLNLDVSGTTKKTRVVLGSFKNIQKLPWPGGFKPTGEVDIALTADRDRSDGPRKENVFGLIPYTNQRSQIALRLTLPPDFAVFGGAPPTAKVATAVAMDRVLRFDGLRIDLPYADLGGLRIRRLFFDLKGSDWRGGGEFLFGSEDAGIRFAPPPSEYGVGFRNGRFSYAGGSVHFGFPVPPPEIFPGVFVTDVGVAVRLNPTLLRGDVTLSVAELTRVSGTLLLVFASPEEPYTLDRASAGSTLQRFAGQTFDSTTIAAGGSVTIRVPKLDYPIGLGNGYFIYAHPGYVAVGGKARVVVPGAEVEGGFEGQFSIPRRTFNIEGGGRVCLAARGLCLSANALVSSTGIGACGELTVKTFLGRATVRPGFGYRWGDRLPSIWLIDGCKLSPYRTQVIRAAAAGGERTFTVARGVRQKMVRLAGAAGRAPEVTVRAPGGETLSSGAEGLQVGRTLRILRDAGNGVTWVGVENAKPGAYTITPAAGSPDIANVATANGLPPARVRASVRGRGARRTLRYAIAPRPGQRVELVEQGATTERVLRTVSAGRGTLRFKPGAGRPGTRRIVARVTLGGVPSEKLTVARFRVAPPLKAGRVARVRATRRGKRLVLRWTRARGAVRYGVLVTLRSGDQRTLTVPARRTTARVGRIPLTQAGSVTVRALTAAGDAGRPASARFKAPRKATTRFLPFARLGRR